MVRIYQTEKNPFLGLFLIGLLERKLIPSCKTHTFQRQGQRERVSSHQPPDAPPAVTSQLTLLYVPTACPWLPAQYLPALPVSLTQSAIWELSCRARQALAEAFTHEALNLWISLENLLTIGRLLVHEYMMSFHLPKSPLISLNNVYCTDFLLLLLNLFLNLFHSSP